MTELITIRSYETKDKGEVLELIRLNTPRFFAEQEEADFKKYLEGEIERYFVVLFNDQIVGCGGVNFEDGGTTGVISWDILHPDFQRKSLGTKLLQYRLEKLKLMDTIQKIKVRTSQVSYKFYEKQGFEVSEIKKDHWADGFDLYLMEFRLFGGI